MLMFVCLPHDTLGAYVGFSIKSSFPHRATVKHCALYPHTVTSLSDMWNSVCRTSRKKEKKKKEAAGCTTSGVMTSQVESNIARPVSPALCHAASHIVFFMSLPSHPPCHTARQQQTSCRQWGGNMLGETVAFPWKTSRGPPFTATSSHQCLYSAMLGLSGKHQQVIR